MIAIACDHGGYVLKEKVKAHLLEKGYEVRDFGTNSLDSCDYPDFGAPAARAVAAGECEKGILICTTGIGMSIVANKIRGIRCARSIRFIRGARSARRIRTLRLFFSSQPEQELSRPVRPVLLHPEQMQVPDLSVRLQFLPKGLRQVGHFSEGCRAPVDPSENLFAAVGLLTQCRGKLFHFFDCQFQKILFH